MPRTLTAADALHPACHRPRSRRRRRRPAHAMKDLPARGARCSSAPCSWPGAVVLACFGAPRRRRPVALPRAAASSPRSPRRSRSACRSRPADRRCRCRTRWISRRCCCSAPTRRCSSRRSARGASARSARRRESPLHRTLFSMASLVLTVKAAGLVYAWLGGPPPGAAFSLLTIAQAARRRGHRLLRLQHGVRRDRHRPVDAAVDRCASGTRTSCGARRATSSAPAPRPSAPR